MTSSPVRSRAAVVALGLLLAGCAEVADGDVASVSAPVVYDLDDRFDVYEVSASSLHRQIAEQAIAVLMPPGALLDNLDGTYSPVDYTLEDMLFDMTEGSFPACDDELFLDQPTAGACSGTLIAEDLYMTAGHCAELCDDGVIVFDYHYAAEGLLETIDEEDVYFCDRVVVDALTEEGLDYAIFELDRPVVGREPVTVDVGYSVEDGDPLVVLGFPSGLPLKIEGGGEVIDARSSANPDYFEATTDTFAGNSGSGVFDADGVAVGILVRGQEDYVLYDTDDDMFADCVGANVIDTSGGLLEAESITYVSRAVDALCAVEPARCDDGTGGGGGGGPGGGGGGGSKGCSAAPGASSPFAGFALGVAALALRRRRAAR